MNHADDLKLFATHPHPCSYLDDQEATTLFIDPEADVDIDLYSSLSGHGFRRSGNHIYRPYCQDCSACISVRVPVQRFNASRSQKRCLKNNTDLALIETQQPDVNEHYQLYERYINERHLDGDMYPPDKNQYLEFLNNPIGCTHYIEMRLENTLIGCAVSDRLTNGLSAIYTYFCPSQQQRSLGKFAILHQIQRTQELNLPYLYLGYWIKNCEKMKYKSDYRPLELLINQKWVTIT